VKLALAVSVMISGERGGSAALCDALDRSPQETGHALGRVETDLDDSSCGRIPEGLHAVLTSTSEGTHRECPRLVRPERGMRGRLMRPVWARP
jgi:hypothetical protein